MNRILLALLLVITLAPAGFGQDKRKPKITIGKDTTYITGPIDADGFPDYEAALNERLREGVTPDNNANVLLFEAFGPHPDGSKIPDDFFKWMKIKPLPEKGDYFVRGRFDKFDDAMPRPWTAQDYPDVADWLKKNEKPLAVVIEATKRSHYYYPLVSRDEKGKQGSLIAALIPGVQSSREFARALAARAMLRLGEKKYDDAWQDLLACHRLGRLVGKGGSLIEGLVGVAIDSIASNGDLAYIEAVKPDAKKARKCLADLQALPAHGKMADKLNLCERFMFLQSVMMIERHGPQFLEQMAGSGKGEANPFAKVAFSNVNWDPALRNGNQWYSRLATAMRLSDRTLRHKHLNDVERDIRSLKGGLFETKNLAATVFAAGSLPEAQGKLIGDIMICLFVPAVMKVQQAAERVEQIQSNLHIAFALAAYKSDEGRYPKTLAALAPKYLAEVPIDIFSGKALIYRLTDDGYLFYSVGANGKDEEGRSYDDEPRGDDLPVRMPLQKVRPQE